MLYRLIYYLEKNKTQLKIYKKKRKKSDKNYLSQVKKHLTQNSKI